MPRTLSLYDRANCINAAGSMPILLSFAALCIAAAPLRAQDPHSSVAVTVAGTKAHALDLATGALTLRSYPITSATESLIITGDKYLPSRGTMFIQATITERGADSAKILLKGFVTTGRTMHLPDVPVTTRFKAQYGQLEQVANDISVAAQKG